MIFAPQDPWGRPLAAPGADEVQRAVDEVFTEEPALREALVPSGSGFDVEALWGAFWRWFLDLVRSIDELRFESPLLYWLILLGLVAVLVLLLVHMTWSFRGALAGQRRYRAQQRDGGEVSERVRDHQELLREARERAAAGAYRDAVHALVLSILALLEERKVMRVAGSWTIREILQRLAKARGVAGELPAFGSDVERATYGADEPSAADWQRLEASTIALARGLTATAGLEEPA